MPRSSDCAYFGCRNNRNVNKEIHFFLFPWKDASRCKEWIMNCGNRNLFDMEPTSFKSRYVCEKHFPADVIFQSGHRKLLSRFAEPFKFECNVKEPTEHSADEKMDLDDGCSEQKSIPEKDVSQQHKEVRPVQPDTSVRTYPGPSKENIDAAFFGAVDENSPSSGSSSDRKDIDALLNMPSPIDSDDTPKKVKLKKKIIRLRRSVKKNSDMNLRLRKKVLSYSTRNVLNDLLKNKSPSTKTLIYMQCNHKRRSAWTSSEKQLALSLYYKSPSNYKFMRKTLGFVLPGISTIQLWLKVFNLRTGLNTNLIEKFKWKVRSMEEDEKQCVLMFDEMVLKKGLDYNIIHDVIEGYEDFCDHGRHAKLAKTAMVFYVQGLLYKWKMPLCYYLSCGTVRGDMVAKLVLDVIKKLQQLGLTVRITVCDQGANNRAALSLLGASKENPKILVEGKEIFTCYDAPHLLKSLRNNLMNIKLNMFCDGNLISWNDIVEAYKIDKSSQMTRSMLKITDKHIYPTNFQKMRVKYAAQIFSHSVSSTLYTLVATGQLQTATAVNTAEFIKKVNNIFDCLNSRVVSDSNPYKSGLSIYRTLPLNTLIDALAVFENVEIFENSIPRKNIYCIDGFVWTIRAVLMLWEKLKDEGKKYLLTSRINQDPLENLFSVIRNRGGYNPQPTSKEFRIALQHNMHIRLMSAESSNCEEDDGELVEVGGGSHSNEEEEEVAAGSGNINTPNIEHSEGEKTSNSAECVQTEITVESDSDNDEVCVQTKITLEDTVNVYVAGYLCFKLFRKFKCGRCRDEFLKRDDKILEERELLLFYKNYGISNNRINYLTRTNVQFSDLITCMIIRFNNNFESFKLKYGVKAAIKSDLISYMENTFNWFEQCREHKMFILDHLIKIKLYRMLKWEIESSKISKNDLKPHRKIRILSSE